MLETQTRVIGEIAADNPATIRVFQKFGIDFCCGGKRPLDEVCQEKGIALEAVEAELAAAVRPKDGSSRDWQTAPLSDLVDHIVTTHHAYLQSELPRLEAMAARVAEKHADKHPYALDVQQVFLSLKDELLSHMRKEEMILFPWIQRTEAARAGAAAAPASCFGSVANPISVMEAEHEFAGQALLELRRLTSDYTPPEDACNGFRGLLHGLTELEADLHLHIHLENNILFPRALAL
jgi:regulator of cell morphogenesis and NO signaling